MKSDLIHIAIVEDDNEIRETLKLIIDGSQGFRCKSNYADAESAISNITDSIVDVVLMDIDLPGKSGIEAVSILKQKFPKVDFIMLTVKHDDDSIFESLFAGATGYLLKSTDPADLLKQIREVFNGGSPMSGQIARRIVNSFKVIDNPLSPRETEVLKMLSKGMNYKEIAEAVFLSPNTIKTHIKNIYSKLHVNSRAEAIYKAIKQHLI